MIRLLAACEDDLLISWAKQRLDLDPDEQSILSRVEDVRRLFASFLRAEAHLDRLSPID